MTGEPVDYALVRALQQDVGNALADRRQERANRREPELSPVDVRQLSLALTRTVVSRHMQEQLRQGLPVPEADFDTRLIAAIDAAIWGAGELQQLLDDPDVENIDINGCDRVFVTYANGRGTVAAPPVAQTDDELIEIVRTLGAYAMNARPLTPSSPELDLRLPDGSRLSATITASPRPTVSLRRNRFPQTFLAAIPAHVHITPGDQGQAPASLQQLGTLDDRLAVFLQAAVLARTNIIVAGGTDAGKTTLLRALINCIPAHERLVTIERALELNIARHDYLHPNVVELEEVLPGADGAGGLSIGQLVQRSRRMNPSRVIVGEVMGPEVMEMLSAMSQGNDGSLSTIHARDATNVFDRLALYAATHQHLPVEVTHGHIGEAVDFVLFVAKNPRLGGQRTITEVVEVTGSSDGRVTRSHLFRPSPVDGRAERDPEVPVMRRDLLAQFGYDDSAWGRSYGQLGIERNGYRR